MDHTDVRALLEDAAIEPGGLERLMAGDTAEAALVASHLAACDECSDEFDRLRRATGVIRRAVRELPPPELRERTLAYVAAMGRPRGAAASGAPASSTTVPPAAAPMPLPKPTPIRSSTPVLARPTDRRVGGRTLGWVAAIAAAVVVAVAGTTLVVGAGRDSQLRDQTAEIAALGQVNRWTLRIDAQPDVHRVALASTTGTSTAGTLVFSRSTTELVVVADRLTPPPDGKEYRCWVETAGTRSAMGKMFFGGDLAYWVGKVPELAAVADGSSFGVTLVDRATGTSVGDAVLVGHL
jgi:hypothetical protein